MQSSTSRAGYSGDLRYLWLQLSITWLWIGFGLYASHAVTKLRWIERILKLERDRLSAIFRSASDGVIASDAEGRALMINKAAETWTGWTQEEALGRPLDEVLRIVSGQAGQPHTDPAKEVLRTGRLVRLACNTVLAARDGTERTISGAAAAVREDDGRTLGAVVLFRDTDCLAIWWWLEGRWRYPDADELLILADGGGSNAANNRAWKYGLQTKLCNPFGLSVTVAHYPPGASKWNPADHRLFSEISKNWAGRPLDSYETILNYLKTTTTAAGLKVEAYLNQTTYVTGTKISDAQINVLHLKPHSTQPKRNYTLTPACTRDGSEPGGDLPWHDTTMKGQSRGEIRELIFA